ncbi:phosphoesterase [Sulfolobales archaeon HS-7]|nr:phosphoesterase [Sulfolobales archaeon HS-7]
MFNADFHVHTYFSDGKNSPEEMISYAKRIGIDVIAITDHDTFDGAKRVLKDAIPGIEITTQYGHVVVLCIKPVQLKTVLPELIDSVEENNCVAFPSHPFDPLRSGIGDLVFEYRFHAIEVYNAKAPRSSNKKALAAAKKLGLPGLANSDSHVKYAIGAGRNVIDINEFDVEEILEFIRKGKTIPVSKGLTVKAKFEIAKWYIERKFAKHTR